MYFLNASISSRVRITTWSSRLCLSILYAAVNASSTPLVMSSRFSVSHGLDIHARAVDAEACAARPTTRTSLVLLRGKVQVGKRPNGDGRAPGTSCTGRTAPRARPAPCAALARSSSTSAGSAPRSHVHPIVERRLNREQRLLDVRDANLERLHHLRLARLQVLARVRHGLGEPRASLVQVVQFHLIRRRDFHVVVDEHVEHVVHDAVLGVVLLALPAFVSLNCSRNDMKPSRSSGLGANGLDALVERAARTWSPPPRLHQSSAFMDSSIPSTVDAKAAGAPSRRRATCQPTRPSSSYQYPAPTPFAPSCPRGTPPPSSGSARTPRYPTRGRTCTPSANLRTS